MVNRLLKNHPVRIHFPKLALLPTAYHLGLKSPTASTPLITESAIARDN